MDTGKVIRIIKNVPQPIPVQIPTKTNTGISPSRKETTESPTEPGILIGIPKREDVEVENS